MGRGPKPQNSRQSKRQITDAALPFSYEQRTARPERFERKPVAPKNQAQKRYLNSFGSNTITIGLGPAGTGKTYLATTHAAELFAAGLIKKIIVTRPIVEAGEELGFLPGELEEKIAPYFVPVREDLERALGKGQVEYALKAGQIVFVPLAFMRGRTFNDAFIILDEAQNTTPKQMKMFLTRIGMGSKMVIEGDLRQSDIAGTNGLYDALAKLRDIPGIGVCKFTRADVVRSGLAQVIVEAYEGDYDEGDDIPLPDSILG